MRHQQLQQRIKELYRQFSAQLQHVPVRGSKPLLIADRIAGFIHPEAILALQDHADTRQHSEAFYIGRHDMTTTVLNQLLAEVATTLRDAGCTRTWRDELMPVYAEGAVIAQIERAALRPLGLLSKAIHLNGWHPSGELYLQLRASTKSFDPNRWDTLVGGLLNADDSITQGLWRESQEEAGLAPEHLQQRTPVRRILRMRQRLPEGYQLEDILVSDCILPEHITPINQDGEVERIERFTVEAALAMIESKDITIEAAVVILDSLMNQQFDLLWRQR